MEGVSRRVHTSHGIPVVDKHWGPPRRFGNKLGYDLHGSGPQTEWMAQEVNVHTIVCEPLDAQVSRDAHRTTRRDA
jgi:hypothetical protein